MHAAELTSNIRPDKAPTLELRVNPQNYLQQLDARHRNRPPRRATCSTIILGVFGKLRVGVSAGSVATLASQLQPHAGPALPSRRRRIQFCLCELKQLGSGDMASKTNHWTFKPARNFRAAGPVSKTCGRSRPTAETDDRRMPPIPPGPSLRSATEHSLRLRSDPEIRSAPQTGRTPPRRVEARQEAGATRRRHEAGQETTPAPSPAAEAAEAVKFVVPPSGGQVRSSGFSRFRFTCVRSSS